jgi:hypothetical protein
MRNIYDDGSLTRGDNTRLSLGQHEGERESDSWDDAKSIQVQKMMQSLSGCKGRREVNPDTGDNTKSIQMQGTTLSQSQVVGGKNYEKLLTRT